MPALVAGNLANVDQIYEQVVQALASANEQVAPVDLAEEERTRARTMGRTRRTRREKTTRRRINSVAMRRRTKRRRKRTGKSRTRTIRTVPGLRPKVSEPLIELIKEGEETEQFTQADDEKPSMARHLCRTSREHICGPKRYRRHQLDCCRLSAIESNFLTLRCLESVPTTRYCALRVVIEYLTALEGDFWVKLRGAGLTYSYTLKNHPDAETISFSLSKCTDAIGATRNQGDHLRVRLR